jgi:hypothetical protein
MKCNVFKTSLWRRLIGKALQARRSGRRLASDWYSVRLTTVASGSHRFGVQFVPDRARRVPYGDGRGRKTRERGRKDGERAGARESQSRAEIERGARGRIRTVERGAREKSERRERSACGEDGPACSPAPPRKATAAEPPPPLYPIHARDSRRRAAVSPPPPLVLHRVGPEPPPLVFPRAGQHPASSVPLPPSMCSVQSRKVREAGDRGKSEQSRVLWRRSGAGERRRVEDMLGLRG